jgi:hypothetical protein
VDVAVQVGIIGGEAHRVFLHPGTRRWIELASGGVQQTVLVRFFGVEIAAVETVAEGVVVEGEGV